MSAKSLIRKLKDIFGLSQPDSEARRSRDGDSVTVEREPDTTSEDAVKGTGSDTESSTASPETATEDSSTPDETDDESESVEVIKGIGPTYRDRLQDSGIETVADLAASDAATVAEAAETSEGRAADWVNRAENR